MTTPLHNSVNVTNPHEVLAAVPHLLGFHPENSLVLITLHGLQSKARVGLTVRADIPEPARRYPLARQLLGGPVTSHKAEAVMLVIVGTRLSRRPRSDGGTVHDPPLAAGSTMDCSAPPHWEVVDAFRDVLDAAGIPVVHASWTKEIRAGAQWWCYDEDHCHGTIDDPAVSPLAAAMAAAGSITFGSRSELEQLVAPESAESIARRSARLDVICADHEQKPAGMASTKRNIDVVFAAIRRTAEGAALTEDDLIRVLIAVSDHRVRDLALSTALGEHAEAAEHLWTTLVRKAPPPELAEVAALLAFSAYLRGEGALACVALERIEATRPDHRLGTLLRQALNAGIPPEDLAVIAHDASEDARTLIEEDGA